MSTVHRAEESSLIAAAFAIIAVCWEFLAYLLSDVGLDESPPVDSRFIGEYNHRTARLDAGTDPYGWYEED